MFAAPAAADDGPLALPADEPPRLAEGYDRYWDDVYFRATNTAGIGAVVAVAAPPAVALGTGVSLLGAGDAGPVLYGAGTAGMVIGPPLLAGGSLRARRALIEQGVRVSPLFGRLAWGFVGAQYALWLGSALAARSGSDAAAGVLGAAGLGCYAGSLASGVLQLSANRRGHVAITVALGEPR